MIVPNLGREKKNINQDQISNIDGFGQIELASEFAQITCLV